MHYVPFIQRPDGHYRLLLTTFGGSALLSLGVGFSAAAIFYLLPEWMGFDIDRMLRGLERSANPILWFHLLSNLCLLIAIGIWRPWFDAMISRASVAMELAAATTLGVLLGTSIFLAAFGSRDTLYWAVVFPFLYLGLSMLARGPMRGDVLDMRDGPDLRYPRARMLMKILTSGLLIGMVVVCQRMIAGQVP